MPFRPWWHWLPGSRFRASRACSRPTSCAAGSIRSFRRPPGSSRAQRVPRNPRRSTRSWPRPVNSWRPATSRRPGRRIRRSWMPTRPARRPRAPSARSTSSPAPPRSADAVAVADAAPGDIDAAFAAADVQILNQDVGAAFDRLIALVRNTSGDDRARVRTRLVELFDLFDPADPGRGWTAQPGKRAVLSALAKVVAGYSGSSHSADVGGSTSTAEAGRPCQGSSVASTPPMLPMPEPL